MALSKKFVEKIDDPSVIAKLMKGWVDDKAVSELFENETDAKNIIKYKEVLSVLESATDKCKNAASVLESIAVKHS